MASASTSTVLDAVRPSRDAQKNIQQLQEVNQLQEKCNQQLKEELESSNETYQLLLRVHRNDIVQLRNENRKLREVLESRNRSLEEKDMEIELHSKRLEEKDAIIESQKLQIDSDEFPVGENSDGDGGNDDDDDDVDADDNGDDGCYSTQKDLQSGARNLREGTYCPHGVIASERKQLHQNQNELNGNGRQVKETVRPTPFDNTSTGQKEKSVVANREPVRDGDGRKRKRGGESSNKGNDQKQSKKASTSRRPEEGKGRVDVKADLASVLQMKEVWFGPLPHISPTFGIPKEHVDLMPSSTNLSKYGIRKEKKCMRKKATPKTHVVFSAPQDAFVEEDGAFVIDVQRLQHKDKKKGRTTTKGQHYDS